jgi:hypothetical protein
MVVYFKIIIKEFHQLILFLRVIQTSISNFNNLFAAWDLSW